MSKIKEAPRSRVAKTKTTQVHNIDEPKEVSSKRTQTNKIKREPKLYIPARMKVKPKKGQEIKTLFITEGSSGSLKKVANYAAIVGLPSFIKFENHIDSIFTIVENHQIENIVFTFSGLVGKVRSDFIKQRLDLSKPFFDQLNQVVSFKNDLIEKATSDKKRNKNLSFFYYHSDNSLNQLLEKEKKAFLSEFEKIRQRNNQFFTKFNITSSLEKLINFLDIKSAYQFFLKHEEIILDLEFRYRNDFYRYDYENDNLIVTLPEKFQNLRFIGNDYYRIDEKLDAHGNIVGQKLQLIKRSTLNELYPEAKAYLTSYYFKGFTNIPDNYNYKESHLGYYNRYSPPKFKPEKGKVLNFLKMVKHIFSEEEITHDGKTLKRYELGLDYIQLLITEPIQQLPILILFSKQRETGKSTFPKFLANVLGANSVKVGNKQFDSDFNEVFADKVLIYCDETLLDRKPQAEKIKDLSTSKTILVNPKGVGQYEIPFFGKLIFTSNNPRMVHVEEYSKRFWIIEVNKPNEDDPLFEEKLEKEIPAVLYYLKNRKLATERKTRMHFQSEWIWTDTFEKTVRINEPQDVSNVRELIKSMFLDIPKHGNQILMPLKNVIDEFFKKGTKQSWVKEVLTDFLEVRLLTNPKNGKSKTKRGIYYRKVTDTKIDQKTGEEMLVERLLPIEFNGRPYVFRKSDFVNDEDIPEQEQEQEEIGKGKDILKGQEHLASTFDQEYEDPTTEAFI